MNDKGLFLEKIKEGKWFLVKNGYTNFLVKMKPLTLKNIDTFIESLWLSNDDWESMCFAEYDSSSWSIKDDVFTEQSSFTYHFGYPEGTEEDSIYDEEFMLDEEKMKKVILSYAKKDFVSEEELNDVWNKLKFKNISEFEELKFK